MPRKRAAEEEERGEAISAVRGDLSCYRKVLLEFLDRVHCDIVELDAERSICRVAIVSSRRITRAVIIGVIENVLRGVETAQGKMDAMLLQGLCKQELLRQVDKTTFVANVLPSSSAEARRKRRDEAEVVRGGPELVDDTTREVCELMRRQIATRDELLEQVRATTKRAKAAPPLPPSPPPPPPPPRAPPPAAEAPEAVASLQAAKRPATKPMLGKRPKSSISKKQAQILLANVADYIAVHRHEGRDIMPAIHRLVDECWATT